METTQLADAARRIPGKCKLLPERGKTQIEYLSTNTRSGSVANVADTTPLRWGSISITATQQRKICRLRTPANMAVTDWSRRLRSATFSAPSATGWCTTNSATNTSDNQELPDVGKLFS